MAFKRSGVRLPLAPPSKLLLIPNRCSQPTFCQKRDGDWVRGRPSWRPLSGGFAQSVCLHLRLEPRHVVAENDQVVLDPGAVPDVIAQQGLGSEAHALEQRNGASLVDRHFRSQFFQPELNPNPKFFLDMKSPNPVA